MLENMSIDELLGSIREHNMQAAAGNDVRWNERQSRWTFMELDKRLSAGQSDLPADWELRRVD